MFQAIDGTSGQEVKLIIVIVNDIFDRYNITLGLVVDSVSTK